MTYESYVLSESPSGVPGFVDGTSALLREPNGLALDFGRQELYVADQGNHAIRVVDLSSQSITTLVGDGNSSNSSLKYPAGLGSFGVEKDDIQALTWISSVMRIISNIKG